MSMKDHSHSRLNLLTGEWVLISPHRMIRPWQGQVEAPDGDGDSEYEPACYLCPGNQRANDKCNPQYEGTFVFDNDFTALSECSEIEHPATELFVARPESGRCRVICYTAKHNRRLATMDLDDIVAALESMNEEFTALDGDESIRYVQVFENRGQMMGCSNQHPHAQIWATANIPVEPARELGRQRAWLATHDSLLLEDYLVAELEAGERVVDVSKHFATVVPWWAVWPFEMLVLPRRRFSAPDEMNDDEVAALARTLKSVLSACDRLFDTSAPYSMGFHPRPSDGGQHPEWLFHVHIYPPLLRSATVRKHLVGFEMLGMPQRDLTPEDAARRLRDHIR